MVKRSYFDFELISASLAAVFYAVFLQLFLHQVQIEIYIQFYFLILSWAVCGSLHEDQSALSKTTWYCSKLRDTVWNYLIVSETDCYYLNIFDNVWNYLLLSETICYCLKILVNILNYFVKSKVKVFGTWYFLKYLMFPEITWCCLKL